jgi:hypothetical protein
MLLLPLGKHEMKGDSMKRVPGRRVAVAVVVVVAIAVGGIAYASIPDANGVIHGCYNTDTGALRVFGKSKDFQQCNAGEKALDWSQTGPTGATGATGPTGAVSSAFLTAFTTADVTVAAGAAVPFDAVPLASGISSTGIPAFTTFIVAAGGVYQVTVDLQGNSALVAQLRKNGVGVGPSFLLNCSTSSCFFTSLLSLTAGDGIDLVNAAGVSGSVGIHSGITIVRIA